MQLPQFQTDSKDLQLMQNKWASILNPVIASPLAQPTILKSVQLVSGGNSIPHLLQRNLQGWMIVRKRASADIYDTQDSNQTPQLTLKLVSSAACVVDIAVY